MHFKFAYFSLFLFHLKLKRQIRSYTPVVSSETIPNSRTKRAKCTCFQTEKVQKPDPPFGAAHTYMAYLREYALKRSGYKQETC